MAWNTHHILVGCTLASVEPFTPQNKCGGDSVQLPPPLGGGESDAKSASGTVTPNEYSQPRPQQMDAAYL